MMKNILKRWAMPLILIFIIPQLINVISCIMMSEKQLEELPMAVYMGDQTALTRQIVKSFDDTETFDIKVYADSASDVEKSMERGEVVFGLVIPKDFTKDLKKLKSPTLVTVIDGTQLSSAAFTKIQSTEILLTTKVGAMISAFKGKFNMSSIEAYNTANPIKITTRLLGNPTRNYINFLMPGLMAALVQVGLVMTTASLMDKNDYSGSSFRKVFLKKLLAYTLAGTLSILIILSVQVSFFKVPMKGNLPVLLLMTVLFTGAVVSMSFLFSMLSSNKVFTSQMAAVFFIPSSILSGYTWPLVAMPVVIQKIAVLMPFTYYGESMRTLMQSGEVYGVYTNCVKLVIMIAVGFVVSILINGTAKHLEQKEACIHEVN